MTKKVFVGMSGGVDSSVTAALLKHAGYSVTGVFIKVWSPEWLPCTWKEERRDAMRVAAHLDIPFMTFDFEKEYKKQVVDYMIHEYERGRTPNPDSMCNKEIKFGSFYSKAMALGADSIATGHYAQTSTILTTDSNTHYTTALHILKESADKNKDQSYFLWTLQQEQLKHILFPVGNLQKSEVRKLAQKFKLPTADKKDSQGICFMGKVDMKEFLQHYIPKNIGNVLDEQGKVIGTHDGAVFYTIGERHGFTISVKTPYDDPYYVIKKDIHTNTITVAQKNSLDIQDYHTIRHVTLTEVNWIRGQNPVPAKNYTARLRYRQSHQVCTLKEDISRRSCSIIFHEPQEHVSCGQSVVVYDGDLCLGGGIIETIH